MNATRWTVMAVMALGGTGCASLPKMDASRPIEIDDSPFGARYKQDGKAIDPRDMADRLKKEPAAEGDASRAQALGVLSSLLSVAGGALIGWPLGQALGDEQEPLWPLAGAGAGALGLAIPLAIWADNSMDDAVEAHNRISVAFPARVSSERAWTPGAVPRRRARPAPPKAFGFFFGASKQETAAACQGARLEWSDEEGAARCSGTPTQAMPGATAQLEFVDGRLSAVELVIRPPDDAQGWASALRETEAALTRLYGKPTHRSFVVPDECKAAERFLSCVNDGKVSGGASWSPGDGRSVALSIVGAPPPSTIRVRLTPGPPKT